MRSEDWDAKFSASEFLFTDRPNQTVVTELADLTPGRALDLAAGQGRNAVWLAGRGWKVTAVDFSPVGLGRAEQLAAAQGADVTFVLADVREWQPQPGQFDLVLIAFLHLPEAEIRGVLHTAAGALASGGTLLVVGHDRDNLTRGTGGPDQPEVLYTVEAVTGALAGLRIDKAEQYERTVRTESGEQHAIDTVVRASRP